MTIVSWNVRGLNSKDAIRHVKLLLREFKPDVLFLMETRLVQGKSLEIKRQLSFDNVYEVPRVGMGGGLMLLWKERVVVSGITSTPNYISCFMKLENIPIQWHFCGFYGEPNVSKRRLTWDMLEHLRIVYEGPWLVIGDFNEILSQDDKNKSGYRNESQIEDFRSTLELCALHPLHYKGERYTWAKSADNESIKERLDWAMVNEAWEDSFSYTSLTHLDYYHSDHRALLVKVKDDTDLQIGSNKRKRFRFVNIWIGDEECKSLIKNCWRSEENTPLISTIKNIQQCATNLDTWHQNKCGSLFREIKDTQKKVVQMHNLQSKGCSTEGSRQLENKLNELLLKEEVFWQQRARVQWLQAGDQNTKFFHKKANARRKNNTIRGLFNEDHIWCTSNEAIGDITKSYYSALFTSIMPTNESIEELLQAVEQVVTDDMNETLTKTFTLEEVQRAVFSMPADKSPGPDGMSALFYQEHWDIVGPLVSKAVLNCISGVADMRRRLITDSVLIAYECLHNLKARKVGRRSYVAMKLDMSKAYDRVEWKFIEKMMLKMGFKTEWVNIVLKCVSSVRYPFQINDSIHGEVINFNKSILYFSSNTPEETRKLFAEALNMRITEAIEKYLGLPMIGGKNKNAIFRPIKDKIWKKLNEYQVKLFSQGGKEILVKAVVQAMPTYQMACFKIPEGIGEEIERLIARFWWGSVDNKQKVHWRAWHKICKPKTDGGLGFRRFSQYNQALLAKQAWRILMNPSSILAQVMKARYFRISNILEADKGSYPSSTWQGILWGRDLLLKGLRRSIGNGMNTRTFRDPWLPRPPSFIPSSRPAYEVARVSDIIESPGKWNNEVVNQYFNVADAECILSIPLSLFNHEDSWFWHYTNHGSYSVGSGYNLAMTVDKFQPSSASDVFSLWWKQFWGLKIPRKILHFAWRGYHEILPTRNGLFRQNIASSTSCQLCGFGGESNAHAIFWCPVAQGIWNLMEFSFLHEVKEEIDFKNVLLYASEVVDREAFAKFIICSWAIWTERNKITHGQQIRQPQFVVEWIISYYESILSMKEGPKKSSQTNGRNREASAGSSTSAQEQRLYSKLMVDATVLSTTSIVGLGAVVFSEDNRVHAALSKPLKVYSDSLALVTAINKGKKYFNELGALGLIDFRCAIRKVSRFWTVPWREKNEKKYWEVELSSALERSRVLSSSLVNPVYSL
ncbi:hypothetical protein CsatB_000568 [Cannabis sativa]